MENFNKRNTKKQSIHKHKKRIYPKEREIRYTSIGQNIGFEENGKGKEFKRPMLILKRIGALYLSVSMTTKGKDNNKYYYKIPEHYFGKDSYIITSQVKTIDSKRCIEKIAKLSQDDFKDIQKKLQEQWF